MALLPIRGYTTLSVVLFFSIVALIPFASASASASVDLYTVCGRQIAADGTVSFKVKTYNTLLPIKQPVSPLDAVIPPKGFVSVTGDCIYVVDSACKIVKKQPACSGNTCCAYSKRPFRVALNPACTSSKCRVWASEFSGRCLAGVARGKCNPV